MNEPYLDGKKLCKRLGVKMWQRLIVARGAWHYGLEHFYFITPLGVAVKCENGIGLFQVPISNDLYYGNNCIVAEATDEFVSPKEIRFNKDWVEELSLRSGVDVRLKEAEPVGVSQVPAVRFKRRQRK